MQNINLQGKTFSRSLEIRTSSILFWLIFSVFFHLFFLLFCKVTYVPPLVEPIPRSRVFVFSPDSALVDPFLKDRVNFLLKYRDPVSLIHPREPSHKRLSPIQPLALPSSNDVPSPSSIPTEKELEFFKTAESNLNESAKTFFPLSKEKPSFSKLLPNIAKQSTALLDEPLQARLVSGWKLPRINTNLLSEARTTTIVVSVDPEGIVDHVLLEESCGNEQADLLALTEARSLRFSADPLYRRNIWGKIKIFWSYSNQFESQRGYVP
ncbi:hypothetical protein [Candidatus Methylacidiphilum infernorum]|uniref:Uncharacterized protein n=1 Tax=Methylacidiphilum infernorum (isolate V4) TaxID=481448 RepID=B3DXS3_METI4|nr:hypothetical protein [Candidatus Methylacidiphilum infernorum]ACD82307.1 Hypothetical protein Minf_0247 [Methylacidiphilum infernorum V4]